MTYNAVYYMKWLAIIYAVHHCQLYLITFPFIQVDSMIKGNTVQVNSNYEEQDSNK